MVSQLRSYWRNTNQMPSILKPLCQGGMVAGPIMLFFILLPISDWTVNGQKMSYYEFWRFGAGTSALTFVGLIAIGTWGMAARKSWSRWTLVFAPLLPIATIPRAMIPEFGMALASGVFFAAIFYECLFHLTAVRKYLLGDN